jgi:hypothetical protein
LLALGAGVFNNASTLIRTGSAESANNLITYGFMSVLPLIFLFLRRTRVAQIIRCEATGLFVLTRAGSQSIPWEQVTEIKQRFGHVIIKSRNSGPLIMMASKKEPLIIELLSHGEKLPLIDEKRKVLDK